MLAVRQNHRCLPPPLPWPPLGNDDFTRIKSEDYRSYSLLYFVYDGCIQCNCIRAVLAIGTPYRWVLFYMASYCVSVDLSWILFFSKIYTRIGHKSYYTQPKNHFYLICSPHSVQILVPARDYFFVFTGCHISFYHKQPDRTVYCCCFCLWEMNWHSTSGMILF